MKKLMTFSIIILTLLVSFLFGNAKFNEETLVYDTNGACAIAAADFNGDNHVDIVYTCYPLGHIQWLQNDGEQNFDLSHMIIEGFQQAKAIDIGDINQDGYIDFAATAKSGNRISLFLNDGSGNFSEINLSTEWEDPGFLQLTDHLNNELIDLNNDDRPDILATACESGRIGWFENEGNNEFTEHILKDDWTMVSGVSAIDIDGDDDQDLFVAAQEGGIWWFENTGDEDVFEEHLIFSDWDKPNWVCGGDINQDGHVDFAATSCGSSAAVGWFMNDGEQNFELIMLNDSYSGGRSPVVSDIDNDGDIDIFATAWVQSITSFFENDGNENFTEKIISTDAYDLLKLFIVDLDSDNDLDILGSSAVYVDDHIRWWESLDNFLEVDAIISPTSGHAPLTVNFAENSYCLPEIIYSSWDVDGDGGFDYYENEFSHTYTDTGSYSIYMETGTGFDYNSLEFENYIRVFDGESCMDFNGDIGLCETSIDNNFALTDEFSFEAVIYPRSHGENNNFGGRIFDKRVVSLFMCGQTNLFNDNSLVVNMITENGNSFVHTPVNSMNINCWSHVAMTYNSQTSDLKVYINGISQELTYNSELIGAPDENSGDAFIIGNRSNNTNTFNGKIDEVRIWDTVISENQINNNMLDYLNGNEANLIAYWKMNQGNGNIITDDSENSFDLLINSVQWAQGTHFEITSTEEEIVPKKKLTISSYPNPFNPSNSNRSNFTNITYSLPQSGNVSISIFNLKGQKVKKLLNNYQVKGEYNVQWNGKDDNNNILPSSVYFFKLTLNNSEEINGKCLLIK